MAAVNDVVKTLRKQAEQLYVDGNYIVIDVVYPYEIAFCRRNTPGKILGWVNQLSDKNWVSAKLLSQFVQLAFEQIGIEIDYKI